MVSHNQERKRLRPLSTLVLGWPQEESIECCATTQPIQKQTATSSWHQTLANESKQPPKWKNFLSRRRLRRQLRRRQDGTDKEETLESVRVYKDHLQEGDDDDALCVESFVRIETNPTSSPEVECVLPRVLDDCRQDNNDNDDRIDCEESYWSWLFCTDSLYVHETSRDETNDDDDNDDDDKVVEDDAWCAAKRGDVQALQQIEAATTTMDWTRTDGFGNTALYYACHSGAARNVGVVRHLLQQWQGPIPTHVLERCKTNAIHQGVVRLLENHVVNETRQQQQEQQQDESDSSEDDETVTFFGLFQEEEGDY